MNHRRQQRGIALITAIFVVALASIAAVAMFEATAIAVRRTTFLSESEAEWWFADGIESWVKEVLILDEQQNQTDGLGDLWAQPVPGLPIGDEKGNIGNASGYIEDLQGRFNLNNLGTTNPQQLQLYLSQFQRLLDNLPNFDASDYRGVGTAIHDWIDADSEPSGPGGAEDVDYLSLDPPYRAANQPLHSTSELLLIKGVTPQLFNALAPYVTALPATATGTPINVNTAPEPVLRALAPDLNGAALEKFLQARKLKPATDVAQLLTTGDYAFLPAAPGGTATGVSLKSELAVKTSYFELHAEISVGSGRLRLYSVYDRSGGTPIVIAHSTNTD
ncbi:MAG: type II secretion system minor pseudopilin GspK [Nevskia sp.]|nr:type II secretion system minor pseudopilin GspK [Nevskia sp.]